MKKLITLGAAGLVALTLAGCGNNTSSKNSKADKPKTERKSSQKQTDYFKNDTIKTKDLSLTINQKDLIQFNDHQALRLLFTINNETNNSIDNLMDNKIVKASQKINGKDVELPIVDEVVNDNTVQKENKNDHVDAKSTVKSVMYFKIKDNNQPVILTAYNNLGQKIGTETIQLNKIKTINLNNQNSNAQQNSNPNSQQQTVQQNVNAQQQQTYTKQNQQQSTNNNQQNAQPQTLQAFVAKYGVSPALYKMQHEGMSELQALESTPDNMKTSGEIQLQHQLEDNQ